MDRRLEMIEVPDRSATAMGMYSNSYGEFLDVAERYRSDEDFRAYIDGASGEEVFSAFGFDLPDEEDVSVRVLVDTDAVSHLVLPPDPNAELSDERLRQVSGGSCAGSAGCVSTASTLQCSTLPSSMSTAGTAGTVSSAS